MRNKASLAGGVAIKFLKWSIEGITLIASIFCLSGIEKQMWQVIPAVVFFVLWLVEMVVWEGAECVIEWLE